MDRNGSHAAARAGSVFILEKSSRHGEDVAQLVEVRVQEALLVVAQAPVGHDGATADGLKL